MDEISATLRTKQVDVFVCSETWFHPDKHDRCVSTIPGYNCARQDRLTRVGGGVAVWIRDCIPFFQEVCS